MLPMTSYLGSSPILYDQWCAIVRAIRQGSCVHGMTGRFHCARAMGKSWLCMMEPGNL